MINSVVLMGRLVADPELRMVRYHQDLELQFHQILLRLYFLLMYIYMIIQDHDESLYKVQQLLEYMQYLNLL